MDKNTVTGFILLALLTVAYVLYSSNEQKKFQEAQKIEAAKTEKKEKIIKDSISKSELIKPDSIIVAEQSKQLGSFSNFAVGEDRLIKVETDESIYTFSSKGGDIKSIELKNFKTYDKQPLLLFDSTQNAFDISFNTAEGKKFKSSNIYFNTDAKDIKLSGDQKTTISFKIESAPGKYYEHLYTIQGNQFLVDFKVNAVGFNDIINTEQLNLNWNLNMPSLESNVTEERMYSTVYYRMDDKSVEELSTSKSESIKSELPVQWVSFKQKFFNVSLIGVKNFSKEASLSIKNGDEKSKDFVKDASTQLSVPYDKSSNFSFAMQWYAGPNKYKELKKLDIGLDEIIPLGWGILGWVNKFMIIPIFNFLNKFISNYGIIILILTLIIKIILSPLNHKQMVSAAKMKLLKPEIDELKKKYGNDKQLMGTKQMELFRNAGVNPMGGCLPILLQMPILFAMYRFFPNSIELRQQPFLWATDLSHYDSIFNLPFSIPLYGDHVSLFTLLMAVTSFVYTQMTMKQQQTSMTDDAMAMQMKIMQYITPFMFLVMFNKFSAALSYYYFLFNLLSILQTVLLQKFFINEAKLSAGIAANKLQPKKKSAWQEKLDEMMKQQQEMKDKQNKGK